jgi:hypothetical protein
MFAVAGTWTMHSGMREIQKQALPALIDGVKKNPGFVRGYWTDDVEDPATSLTFIVFETLEQARSFRDAVIENAPGQADAGVERGGLRIVELIAEA